MLDYTIVAGQRVWRSIQRVSRVFNILAQLIAILFLAYTTFEGWGFFPLNVTLLTLSAAYFIFYCATAFTKKGLRRGVKRFFQWSKRGIKLVNLGVTLYALFSNGARTNLDVLLACVSLGCWALDILLEILAAIVKSWGRLMKEALLADIENIPIVNRFLTKPQEGEEEPSKERALLDGLVAERKETLAVKKREEKAALAQKKQDAKQAKKEEKQAKKLAKRQEKRGEVLDETAITEG